MTRNGKTMSKHLLAAGTVVIMEQKHITCTGRDQCRATGRRYYPPARHPQSGGSLMTGTTDAQQRARAIRLLLLDVDGVAVDGGIVYDSGTRA